MLPYFLPHNRPWIEEVIVGADVEKITLEDVDIDGRFLGTLEYTINNIKKVAKAHFLINQQATQDILYMGWSIGENGRLKVEAGFWGFSDSKITHAMGSAFAQIILQQESTK